MIGSARSWREIPQRYRLEAGKCEGCGKIHFPPRVACSGCRGRKFGKVVLAPEGKLETFTVIRVAPRGFSDLAPYAVGVVSLDDGVKITAQVADCDPAKLALGQRVRIEFRRVQQEGESGVLLYGYKVVPALGGGRGG